MMMSAFLVCELRYFIRKCLSKVKDLLTVIIALTQIKTQIVLIRFVHLKISIHPLEYLKAGKRCMSMSVRACECMLENGILAISIWCFYEGDSQLENEKCAT